MTLYRVRANLEQFSAHSGIASGLRAITAALFWAIGEHPELILVGPHGPVVLWEQVTVVHGGARGADTLVAPLVGLQDPREVTRLGAKVRAPRAVYLA